MKKLVSLALVLALCLGLVAVPAAAAADEPLVAVSLNGEALTFTDAVPQVRDQRTFLPFRAVFEALGAQVSNEGNHITAVRGDTTVDMTIGSTQVTVTRAGKVSTLEMDVAPYVDAATWRTYVPVRFAAQTLDCAVGWDQDAFTAVIIDKDALFADATEGLSFTKMEALGKYLEKYEGGNWCLDMDLDPDISVMGIPLEGSGKLFALFSEEGSAEMTFSLEMSLLGATQTMQVRICVDAASGRAYLNMVGVDDSVDPSVWYDMAVSTDADSPLDALLDSSLLADTINDADAYDILKLLLQMGLALVSDDAFELHEDGYYVSSLDLGEIADLAAALILLQKDGEMDGVEIELAMGDEENDITLMAALSGDGLVEMEVDASTVTADGMDVEMTLYGAGTLTRTTDVPQTTLPAGATILPLE